MTKFDIWRANAKSKNVIPTQILSFPMVINNQSIGKGKTNNIDTGSDSIIDLGNRVVGNEIFDCGLRV